MDIAITADETHEPHREHKTVMQKALDWVEVVGNRVPHPVVIFVALIVLVVVLSAIVAASGASVTYEAINPETHALEEVTTAAKSLLSADGIRFMYADVVRNFMAFTAVGVIIVAMLGVGVAEASGLIKALIRKLVLVASPRSLTPILILVGVLSSIAADAGYLVLVPLAAAAYASVGRHPLTGLAASFAGVAAVFSVNIFIKPLDGILVGLTNDAVHLVDPGRDVTLTSNLWFSIASVILLTIVCWLVTDKVIEPRLGPYEGETEVQAATEFTAEESRGLKFAVWALIVTVAFFMLLWLPPGAPLRNPDTGALIYNAPFMNGLIVFIALAFLAAGAAYGVGARTMTTMSD